MLSWKLFIKNELQFTLQSTLMDKSPSIHLVFIVLDYFFMHNNIDWYKFYSRINTCTQLYIASLWTHFNKKIDVVEFTWTSNGNIFRLNLHSKILKSCSVHNREFSFPLKALNSSTLLRTWEYLHFHHAYFFCFMITHYA